MRALLLGGALLLALALAVAWWPRSGAPDASPDAGSLVEASVAPGPARGTVAPRPPNLHRVVRGSFVDEEGHPVVDAGVSAFADADAWAEKSGFLGCDAGLFTCGSVAATKEVLERVRAGTLSFPEPIASTRTDADGGFVLEGLLDDALLVGTFGAEQLYLDIDELPEPIFRLYGVVENEVAAVQSVSKDSAPAADVVVTLINPFTREVQTGRTDREGTLAVQVARPWYWAAAEAPGCNPAVRLPSNNVVLELAPPRTLEVQLRAEHGPVDGEVRAWCEGAEYQLASRDAGVRLTDVPASPCMVMADAPGLTSEAKTVAFDERGLGAVTLTLFASASLTITVFDAETGEPVGDGAVLVSQPDSARPPRAIPMKAGARGLLRGTQPRTLLLQTSFPGYLAEVRDVVLVPGTTDLEFALHRARRISGIVVDATGHPVPHVGVTARFAGAGPTPQATGEDGGFSFHVDGPGPWRLLARSDGYGSAEGEVTAPGEARLVLAAKNELLVYVDQLPRMESAQVALSRVDGTPLPANRGGLSVWQGPGRAADLPPGEYRLLTRRDGFVPSESLVTVPAEGTVTVTVHLERGHAVSGVVLDEKGRPVADATVRFELDDESARAGLFARDSDFTDARGRFSIEHLPGLPGKVTVDTQTASAKAAVTPPARGVTLRLTPDPHWTGRAVDTAGKPITSFVANDQPVTHPEGRFDVAGTMLNLKAGERSAYETGAPRDVGDLVLRGSEPVKVRVLLPGGRPATKARVLFRGVGHYWRSTDADGRVAYQFLEGGGEHRVKMYAVHSEGFAHFEATSAEETTVTLKPWLRVQGRVLNERGDGVADEVSVNGLDMSHELRVSASADGRFVARVAPGTWAFATGNSNAGLVVKIDRDGQQVELKAGNAGCELRLVGDSYEEAPGTITLSRPTGDELQRLPYSAGAELPLGCGRWRASVVGRDGGVAAGEFELQPPRARVSTDPRDCEHRDEPCFVLAPAVQGR